MQLVVPVWGSAQNRIEFMDTLEENRYVHCNYLSATTLSKCHSLYYGSALDPLNVKGSREFVTQIKELAGFYKIAVVLNDGVYRETLTDLPTRQEGFDRVVLYNYGTN